MPTQLWVEGIKESAAAKDIELKLSCTIGTQTSEDTIKLTVYGIQKVEWEALDSPLDDNPNPGGGKRIFPDWPSPTAPSPQDKYERVKVKATILPAISGRTICFYNIDVDDPSASGMPIDNESNAEDNHGGAGAIVPASANTNGSGIAESVFTTTLHPGDNFRIVASLAPAGVGFTPKQGDTAGRIYFPNHIGDVFIPDDADSVEFFKATPMLTVWRRLWIESDAMSAAGANEPFGKLSGESEAITYNTLVPQGGLIWREDSLNGAVLDPDGDEASGTVNYVGLETYEVKYNNSQSLTVYAGADYYGDTFDNDGQNGPDDPAEQYDLMPYAANPSYAPFSIETDDPEWAPGTSNPSASETVSQLDFYFNPAYIKCYAAQEGWNPNSTFTFARNVIGSFGNTINLSRGKRFWSVAVAWCYDSFTKYVLEICTTHNRSTVAGDDDPEHEGVPAGPGNMLSVLGEANGRPGFIANLYRETIRDREADAADLFQTAAHETGHLLGLRHAIYTDGSSEDDNGIMRWERPSQFCEHTWRQKLQDEVQMNNRFSNNNLRDLRSKDNPW